MTDEKYTLQQTNKERSQLIPSVYKRRTHNGKGGAMKTPSDFLSSSEKRAMCSTMQAVTLTRPISFDCFQKLSPSLQEQYMKSLIETYHGSTSSIAKMFDISEAQVKAIRSGMHINYPGTLDQSKWESFISFKPEIPMGPISRGEFDRMVTEDQKAYLQGLRDRYDLTLEQIANLLHMGRDKTNDLMKALGVPLNRQGVRQDPDKKAAWLELIEKMEAPEEMTDMSDPASEAVEQFVEEVHAIEEVCEDADFEFEDLTEGESENPDEIKVVYMDLSVEIGSWDQLHDLLKNFPISNGTKIHISIS